MFRDEGKAQGARDSAAREKCAIYPLFVFITACGGGLIAVLPPHPHPGQGSLGTLGDFFWGFPVSHLFLHFSKCANFRKLKEICID